MYNHEKSCGCICCEPERAKKVVPGRVYVPREFNKKDGNCCHAWNLNSSPVWHQHKINDNELVYVIRFAERNEICNYHKSRDEYAGYGTAVVFSLRDFKIYAVFASNLVEP